MVCSEEGEGEIMSYAPWCPACRKSLSNGVMTTLKCEGPIFIKNDGLPISEGLLQSFELRNSLPLIFQTKPK
ncbi:hypothetical protein A2316_04325 [Candidatus Falkowbacteria bacterium RIFOXYB2_FULL_38_15]|uniref:Uncharacterized protein n=1 Tax=Candidatus Falkowbacteria bacterium RIFOXYA2_FULL_38_12 TaxID=1797993 RepID=A0A1F5S4G0_9BACT|nr:MAG: hypothetical protein A2257_01245 [Candidatus Falkowbacteria bacterium RIFOXYA2_FULL_38_12]OGF33719.1 MAG: hypothetical protein A2316_04325 [Candidatus Falkowbacteria bacterium RIFOXYB2_FULL_38_15]OGF42292.1 MAG: hypothetical protein A2555_04355 [Candidatus Falkowbacteria bacterium RIFOXYD2_FULL_39_16]